jgi:fatty acid desaturase
MLPRSIADYARVLRKELPHDAFAPRPSRLAWVPLHLAVIAIGIAAIARGMGGIPVAAAIALAIGHSFACLAFVAHETLHGAVVRGRLARHVVGWIGFLPFWVSPRLWVVWHNRVHHGHTMEPGVDPDAYPSLTEFRQSRVIRLVDQLSLGKGHLIGVSSLILGFTVQSIHLLFQIGGDRKLMSAREQALTVAESLAGAAIWVGLALWLGPLVAIFGIAVPLVVGNAIVMAYILTNHSLSPYTEVNDPLLNSLSVRAPKIVEILHLQFGYHVEHHLFPTLSPARAPLVRALLRKHFPERYQSLTIVEALLALARTPRIHGSATTLVDPATGQEFPTLLPGEKPAEAETPPVAVPALA